MSGQAAEAVIAEPGPAGSAGRLLVLCYHAVSERWPVVGAVTPAALRKQLHFLLRRGYRPKTLSGALRGPVHERTLVVTFDDAHRSVLEKGLPVLAEMGVPATVFAPTDFVPEGSLMTWSTLGRWVGTAHQEELRCLDWDGLLRLAEAGWEIGSHTASHPRLTELGEEAVVEELQTSKGACEEALQAECVSLAYPYGSWDGRLAELAAEAGYRQAVTLEEQPLAPLFGPESPFGLSRDGVYRWTSRLEFALATSPAMRWLRASEPYRRLRS